MAAPTLSAVVLAAGHGTRMRSERPKPLHVLVGKPMVVWVLDALGDCDVAAVSVVVGHGGDRVTKRLVDEADHPLRFVTQEVQRGTGDAAAVGLTGLDETDYDDPEDVLVLTADTPLLRPSTVAALVDAHRASGAAGTVLTAVFDDPTGYGRIVRGRDDRVVGIVEQADCTPEQAAIGEINTGIFCFRRSLLAPALRRIDPGNAQGEYCLTDVVSVLAETGHTVGSVIVDDASETQGINDRRQLASAEHELRRLINDGWMAEGVTFVDPRAAYIDATVSLGRDVTVYPNTVLRGDCTIGAGAELGPGSHLSDTTVGAGAVVAQTVATGAVIGVLGVDMLLPDGHIAGGHTGVGAEHKDDGMGPGQHADGQFRLGAQGVQARCVENAQAALEQRVADADLGITPGRHEDVAGVVAVVLQHILVEAQFPGFIR